MAQPANTTGWDSGNNNVVAPPGTKKALGWVVNEKPASGYFNWLFVTIESWLVWLSTLLSTSNTWTANQIFEADSSSDPGATFVASATQAGAIAEASSAHPGILGTGGPTVAGIQGNSSGAAGIPGVYGKAIGIGGGVGVTGATDSASTSDSGINGSSTGAAPAVNGTNSGTGVGGQFTGTAGRGPLNLTPTGVAVPTAANAKAGDFCVTTTHCYVCITAGTWTQIV